MSYQPGEIVTWDILQKLVNVCEEENIDFPMGILKETRTDEIQAAYDQWKQTVGENGLFYKIFGTSEYDIVIRLNDFPYNLELDLIHYVVWLRPNQTGHPFGSRMDSILLEPVTKILCELHDIVDIIHFRNAPKYRTINTIDHYHVMVRLNNCIKCRKNPVTIMSSEGSIYCNECADVCEICKDEWLATHGERDR